ncbi:MAG: hypothetical protein U9P71_00340 [Campylobacterota bacterium]|nr:hypothetical protein [Campylobacterota bacterium]
MKVAVQCVSPLLQKSLEIFLKPHLCSLKQCDVVLRDMKVEDDEHPSIYIATDDDADIKKPFSPSELKIALHKIVNTKDADEEDIVQIVESLDKHNRDFELLEAKIDTLTQEYKQNILNTVKEFYEE